MVVNIATTGVTQNALAAQSLLANLIGCDLNAGFHHLFIVWDEMTYPSRTSTACPALHYSISQLSCFFGSDQMDNPSELRSSH